VRDVSCSSPNDDGGLRRRGFLLDSPESISLNAQRLYQQAVVLKAMPLGNVTQMTDSERKKIAAWFQGGALN